MPSTFRKLEIASILSYAVAPIALMQGIYLRRTIPRLPEAAGERRGRVGDGDALRVLVFGESTAAGVGADTQQEALGGQVARALAEQTGKQVVWRVVGKNGVTARACSAELIPQLNTYACDVVIIALGANDVFRMRPAAVWQRDLSILFYQLHHCLGPIPILFSGLPPVGKFPALPMPLRGVLGLRTHLLNEAAKQLIAQLATVYHIDIDFPGDPIYFGPDLFHPGPVGYAAWADVIAKHYTQLASNL